MKLSQAVSLAASVVGGQNAAPYAPHVGLIFDGVSLTVSGVAPALRIAIDVDPIEGLTGAVWCDAKHLAETLARMPDATVRLKAKSLEVSSGKSRAKVPTHDGGLRFGETDAGALHEMDGAALSLAIGRVIDAANPPDRAQISGVYLDGDCAVATDGHRLHISALACPTIDRVIPIHVAQAIARACDAHGGGPVRVVYGASQVQLIAGDVRLAGPVPSDAFIPWRQVAGMVKHAHEATCLARDLIGAVKIARLAARGGTGKGWTEPPVRLSMADGQLTVASSVDDDTSSTIVATGECGSVMIAAAFLEDALSAIGADDVTLRTAGPRDPLEIVAGGERRIIMPRVA